MKKLQLILLVLAFFSAQGWAGENPQRIISLSPHITEILYALDADDRIVAVTNFCLFPQEAQAKEKIGGFIDINLERIVTMKPDLVLGIPAHNNLAQQLAGFGIRVEIYPNETTADILLSIERIGKDIASVDKAAEFIKKIKTELDVVRENCSSFQHYKAMLVIGREKGSLRNITVAGPQTFISELWQLCGGINIFADLPARYSPVNAEEILLRKPDVIMEFDVSADEARVQQVVAPEWLQQEFIPAVEKHNVFVVSGSHTLIPGPRMTELARQFEQIIRRIGTDQKPE